MPSNTLSVSKLAELAGISADTVRYYGRIGLLVEAGRTPGGHRYFDERAVDRVRFIKAAQCFDISLDEIGAMLAVHDSTRCMCRVADSLFRQKIAAIDEQRASLAGLRDVLCRLLGDDVPEPEISVSAPGTFVERPVPADGAQRKTEIAELRRRLDLIESNLHRFMSLGRLREHRRAEAEAGTTLEWTQ